MNKPIIFITLAYIAGICIANALNLEFSLFLVIIAAAGTAFVFLSKKNDWRVLALFACLGTLLYSYQSTYFAPNNLRNIKDAQEITSVQAVVVSEPEANDDKIYFYADVDGAYTKTSELAGAAGKIRITLEKNLGFTPQYGDVLMINGKLKAPAAPLNPGEFDYKRYLSYKQVYYTLYAKDTACEKTGVKIKNWFYFLSYKAKDKLLEIIYSSLPEQEARVLDGLMLGNQRAIPDDVYDRFKITGTVHILAVSGMNVGLIAFFVFLMLKLMRVKRKIAAVMTMVLITVFAVITGAGASIVRATLMGYIVLIAIIIERDADMMNSLATAALLILIINPSDLYDAGFQLSFLATAGLIYYSEWVKKLFPKVPETVSITAAATIAAQIFLTPVMVNTFHQLSLISVFANLIIVPLSGTISILGFTMWLFGMASMEAAKVFGASIWALIKFMMFFVDMLSRIPYAAISVKTLPLFYVAGYYLVFMSMPHNDIDIKYKKFSAKYVLLAIICGWSVLHVIVPAPSGVYIPALRGMNAAFVQTKENKKILVIGKDSFRSKAAARSSLVPVLRYLGINNIDTLAAYSLTEKENSDAILRNFRVGAVYADRVSAGLFINPGVIENEFYFKSGSAAFINLSPDRADITQGSTEMIFARAISADIMKRQGAIIYPFEYDEKQVCLLSSANTVIINPLNSGIYRKIPKPSCPGIWDAGEKGMFYKLLK